jgi:hypothetical protein
MKYRITIADNFHYMDESEYVDGGEFDSYDDALTRAGDRRRKPGVELGGGHLAGRPDGALRDVRGRSVHRAGGGAAILGARLRADASGSDLPRAGGVAAEPLDAVSSGPL